MDKWLLFIAAYVAFFDDILTYTYIYIHRSRQQITATSHNLCGNGQSETTLIKKIGVTWHVKTVAFPWQVIRPGRFSQAWVLPCRSTWPRILFLFPFSRCPAIYARKQPRRKGFDWKKGPGIYSPQRSGHWRINSREVGSPLYASYIRRDEVTTIVTT